MTETSLVPTSTVMSQEEFERQMVEYAGEGSSPDLAHRVIPWVRHVQRTHGYWDKADPKYIEGCDVGDFILENTPHPLVKGKDGFGFIQSHFRTDWVEWKPLDAGGGKVATYRSPKEFPSDTFAPEDAPMKRYRQNGNEVVETRYHLGHVIVPSGIYRFTIIFKSTGLRVSDRLNTMIRNNRFGDPISGPVKPAWFAMYHIFSRDVSNNKGKWAAMDFNFIRDLGPEDGSLIAAGMQLNEEAKADKVKVAEEEDGVVVDETTATKAAVDNDIPF